MKLKLNNTILKKSIVATGILIAAIFICDLLFPLPDAPEYSQSVYSAKGNLLSAYLTSDDKWRMRTRIDEVTDDLKKSLIEKEDKWFYYHPGVNPISIIRALYSNITSGKRVSGASTITMQTVRLLEPAKRTYFNKFREMLRAFQLELHYSKDEILELYLSLLPYGGNIEGVKSAAYIYFNRPPDKLSLAQCILLSVIPNDPNKLRPDINPINAKAARTNLINYFKKNKTFPKILLSDADDEAINAFRHTIPNSAPHLCRFIKSKYKDDIIQLCLDESIQLTAEKHLRAHVNSMKFRGISNGASLVIDNKTSSVIAYCGSADFNDSDASGQVDGVQALRSPGSTLKAPLFAYAIDLGLITPKSRISDIPTDFSGYSPENYDSKFKGSVTAEYALKQSLNIPAVKLLHQVGIGNYTSILEQSGFSDISKRSKYMGLSLILGGCGATLEELVRLYSVMARGGKLYNLRYRSDHPADSSAVRIFSEDAVYITSQILSDNDRPDFSADLVALSNLPLISWKTGTSYGRRDAWAIGYNPDYTIGVWMGNFNAEGSSYLSGAQVAVPLLFRLFNAIDYDPENKYFPYPENTGEREVCAETGMLPSDKCDKLTTDFYIENKSSNKVRDLYQKLYVNEDSTIQYCPECLPDSGYIKVDYPVYEPALTLWFLNNEINFKQAPLHNPECTAIRSDDSPRIISPSPDYDYLIDDGNDREILLQAAPCQGASRHYWYINDKFYAECKPEEKIFFKPQNSKIKITCTDDKGRSSTVNVRIKFI